MEAIEVDDIAEVNYLDAGVEIRFKDGTVRSFSGSDMPEVLALLNHWTPPTA